MPPIVHAPPARLALEDVHDEDIEMGETIETSSHTVEELKQINQQLYKYSLKHILNSR